jgi:hypothetical protein
LSRDATDIHLCPATFVDLSADQERHAIEALAELLVPFLTDPHRVPSSFSCDPEPGSDLLTEPAAPTVIASIGDP